MNSSFAVAVQNCFQGSPIPFVVNFWDTPPVNSTAGTPMDISGWSFFFTWKLDYKDLDSKALWLKDWTIVDGTGGSTTWEIPSSVTITVSPNRSTYWDLKIQTESGVDPQHMLYGGIYLNPTVTRRLVPMQGVGHVR
jgi:hypothetical protein